MILCEALNDQIKEGINQMADFMKALVYNEAPDIFEQIDFDNDKAFLEPFLFTYFNNQDKKYPLESILNGYLKEKSETPLQVLPNKEGIAYIPQIGYFKPVKENKVNPNVPDELPLLLSNGIELLTHQHSLVEERFEVNVIIVNQPINTLTKEQIEEFGKAVDGVTEVEITQTTKYHYNHLQKAFDIIEEHLSALHEEILLSNRRIVLFHNRTVLCFVTIQVHGTSFITTIPENDEIFFIEEIIHQCSHNTFNSLFFNKDDYFKIDVENTILGTLIGKEDREIRTVYSVLHGLCTVAKRFEAFHILYKKNIFSGKQKHEFLGRFADLRKRSKLGLELLNHSSVFTAKGLEIYNLLDQTCTDICNATKELEGIFNFSNQPSEFSYKKFCELNPLSKFEHTELFIN